MRWNFLPDSDLYVIYTAGQRFANLANPTPGSTTRIDCQSSSRTLGDLELTSTSEW
jgi:hypothetical protein